MEKRGWLEGPWRSNSARMPLQATLGTVASWRLQEKPTIDALGNAFEAGPHLLQD